LSYVKIEGGCFVANKFYKKEVEIEGRERRVESQVIY